MDLEQSFDSLKTSYKKTVKDYITAKLDKARDKPALLVKCSAQVNAILFAYSAGMPSHKPVYQQILGLYADGESLETIITFVKQNDPEAFKIAPAPGPRDQVEYIPFSQEDEALIRSFPKPYGKFLTFFAGYFVLSDMKKEIPGLLDENKVNPLAGFHIEWSGEKDNKNEFVQLMYGLHKAGLLNEGKGEITKIVESMARVFGVELGNNWHSNLSASIHKAKIGYNPPVFNKISMAYEQYAKELVESRRKNR